MARKYIARSYHIWYPFNEEKPTVANFEKEEEIMEWDFSENPIYKTWKSGEPIPNNDRMSVIFPELFLLPEFKGYSGKTELFVPWEEYLKKRKAEEKYQPSKKTNKTQKKWVRGNSPGDHWEWKNVPVYEPLSEDEIYQEWKRYAEEWEKDKYIFSISITPNEFVEIYAGNQDLRNIKPSYFDRILYAGARRIRGRGLEYLLRYKNFSQLPQGETKLTLTFTAYAVNNGNNIELEKREVPITLKREGIGGGSGSGSGGGSKDTYTPPVVNMTLNNATRELFVEPMAETGELFQVAHFIRNINSFLVLHQKFGGVAHDSEGAAHWQRLYTFENDGLFKVEVDNDDLWAWAKFSLSENYKRTGVVEGFDFSHDQVIVKEDNWLFQRVFSIRLNVINDLTSFSFDKKHYEATLYREKRERYEGSFRINNANRLTYTITPSAGLEIVEVKHNGEPFVLVKFRSKSAETFPLGLQEEYITVKSNRDSTQIVTVNLTIKTNLDFEQKDIYFCLDKDILTIAQTNEQSEFARAKVVMNFSGYGRWVTTSQEYEYVFFNNMAKIDLGEEIQDFFENLPDLKRLYINNENTALPVEVMKATEVNVTIVETNFKGEEFKTHKLSSLRYLPGRTPLSYPYLTNVGLRSTYTDSLISVSALTKAFKRNDLGKIASNSVDSSGLVDDYGVANLCFYRKNANRFFGKNTIIKKSTLSLEPKPEPNGEPITVLFQNQNFCPDWFSFSGELEHLINYENTLSQHAEKDEEFKALVKEKRTFKLNTGWIFPEEVELLWELIKSPQCFIKANDTDWVKVIPISQKPLSYDNTRNLHSYVVEFQRASIQ